MPLEPGNTRGIIGRNIAELEASGRPRKQAIAIALSEAQKTARPANVPWTHRKWRRITGHKEG